ncbi:MAG TPA: VWA domain-containing protein [Gemmatimonadaceae bacterium]|nr:VWA domain-containing protein [Gemmatimonadaceae bacterium]
MDLVQIVLASFDRPWLLLAAVLGPVVILSLLVSRERRRRMRLARLGPPELIRRLVPPGALRPPRGRRLVLPLAALLAGIALAGPRWGEERTVQRSSGVDVVLALDASLSMLATDEKPSRLQRMKEEVRRLRDLSAGDRTALIAFAGRSYVLTPLTIDDGAIELFVDNLDPSVVGQPGTSLARAIRQGTELLGAARTASDRAFVLMSDGEGFDDDVETRAAAKEAGDAGISVVTVGFGTAAGSTIPQADGDTVVPKRDENGDVVVTHYSPQMLQTIAEAAHGTFIPAEETDKAAKIHAALRTLRAQQRALERGQSRAPRFQLFLVPALLLLLFDTLFAERSARAVVAVRRRGPATAAAAVAFLGMGDSTSAHPPAPPPPSVYAQAISTGDKSPRTMYNYGTALLAADSLDGAVSALTFVTGARETELRYRALFNLGLAHLKRGLDGTGDAQRTELDAALGDYKRVLLMRPSDPDAKWNYELALRARQSGGGGGGGGGGGAGNGQQRPSSGPPQPSGTGERPEGQLGKRQAEEILQSAAREEREVEGKKQRQTQTDVPPMGKDW